MDTGKVIYRKKKHNHFLVFPNEFLLAHDIRRNDHFLVEVEDDQLHLLRSVPLTVLRRERNKYFRRIIKHGNKYLVTRNGETVGKLEAIEDIRDKRRNRHNEDKFTK